MSNPNTKKFVRDIAHSVVVPGSRVYRSAEVAHVGVGPGHQHESPVIELVVEDDVVRAIDVTCACGQKMRLWCSYEADAESSIQARAS
jgi:hypothetical protein